MQSERKLAGELYWCLYPLTDKVDKNKRRPVLIISSDESNQLDDDYIVLPITRTVRSDIFSLSIHPVNIEKGVEIEGEIRCNKPFTVRNSLISDWIGKLEDDTVDEAIKLTKKSIDFHPVFSRLADARPL